MQKWIVVVVAFLIGALGSAREVAPFEQGVRIFVEALKVSNPELLGVSKAALLKMEARALEKLPVQLVDPQKQEQGAYLHAGKDRKRVVTDLDKKCDCLNNSQNKPKDARIVIQNPKKVKGRPKHFIQLVRKLWEKRFTKLISNHIALIGHEYIDYLYFEGDLAINDFQNQISSRVNRNAIRTLLKNSKLTKSTGTPSKPKTTPKGPPILTQAKRLEAKMLITHRLLFYGPAKIKDLINMPSLRLTPSKEKREQSRDELERLVKSWAALDLEQAKKKNARFYTSADGYIGLTDRHSPNAIRLYTHPKNIDERYSDLRVDYEDVVSAVRFFIAKRGGGAVHWRDAYKHTYQWESNYNNINIDDHAYIEEILRKWLEVDKETAIRCGFPVYRVSEDRLRPVEEILDPKLRAKYPDLMKKVAQGD